MTITEKILAAHTGRGKVEPGEFIEPRVDMLMLHDGSWLSLEVFQEMGAETVFDREKVAIIPDHFIPSRDTKTANRHNALRAFARKHAIANFYDIGRSGIAHAVMVEEGLVLPGELAVATDSHTVTYGAVGAFSTGLGVTDGAAVLALGTVWLKVPSSIKIVYRGRLGKWVSGKDLILYTIGQIGVDGARYRSLEFTGQAVADLPMADRLTMCNMTVEAGGKNGIFPPDEVTRAYVEGRARRPFTVYQSDPDARYAEVYEWEVSDLKPQVAFPHSPANVRPIDEVGEVPIDQAFVGSCTNGWLEDVRVAAKVLKGKKVNPNVRLVVIPATQRVYIQAAREGLLAAIAEAGGAVCTPNCGPCTGGQMGVLGAGERAVSSSNRNFKGRMGAPSSEVYLASPAVVAASAVKGRLADPEEVVS